MKRFNIMTAKKYPKQDGSQGTKWVKLGSVVQNNDGKMFGDLDCIPTGSWFDGSIHLFEVEQQQQSNQNQNNQYNQQPHQDNKQSNNYNPNSYGSYQAQN